jgi:hypothetical protein
VQSNRLTLDRSRAAILQNIGKMPDQLSGYPLARKSGAYGKQAARCLLRVKQPPGKTGYPGQFAAAVKRREQLYVV